MIRTALAMIVPAAVVVAVTMFAVSHLFATLTIGAVR